MWYRAFLKTDHRNNPELNMEYIHACVERFNSGMQSDNAWTAKLMQMAYDAGYEAGKQAGEEAAMDQMVQIQLLTMAAPMGRA